MVAVGYVRCRRVTPHTTCALDILYTFTPEAMCFAANQLGLSFLKSTSGNLCNFSKGPDLVHLIAVSDIVPVVAANAGTSSASLSQNVIQSF